MADFDLTQSGQEIQNILDGAAMQTDLTAEIERAEQAEQQLQGNIDIEETRAKAAEKQNADDIDVIEGKIPAAASSENQLADKAFVNSSIATATATYRGAYNLVSDLHLTTDATEQQIAAALAGAISTADNNDYCFVQVPTADATPTQIAAIERYKFNGTAWAYEYTLNNSGFTADQWAALNSGITTGLVAKLAVLPTNDELTLLLGGKQDVLTFDNVPTEGSNNPVKSGGVKSAIDSEKERAQGAEQANAGNIAQVIAMIPAAASSENQLADKNFVNSSIATNTATYRGAYNEVSDLSLTVDATHEQIAAALAGAISTADNNDYCFVQVPTADATPTQIAAIERYKFNGTAWAYEYTLNNSGFTADQWAAINSGITSGLVAKLAALPTNDDLVAALAGKQPMLTFDNAPTEDSNNPVKSGGVYAAIAEEADTRAAAIAAIVALIPSAASALNQLADKAFVNSSISTATAVFKGTFNVVADLELNYNASQAQIALMLGSKITSADNNDYCFVQIPTSNETPLEIARTDRYKYNGTAWAYEYTLNNSGFTAAQWAAINSGITSLLKDKLIDLPTATELATQLAAKQNALTFDTAPTEGSTNPVTSDGIHAAINVEKERAEAAEADRYTKSETYNKTEINGLVSTPHQNYVTVPTYSSLPSSGQSTDTIYRVSSYDGANSQVDNTVYSEYAWDGTQYVFLDVKSQIEEVFDITEYNSGTKYADLSAALGVDGANIPATLRRGGMSIKYVQSSDNKYVQYRLMADSFSTIVANWQGVDDAPTAGSNNTVKSGGVYEGIQDLMTGGVDEYIHTTGNGTDFRFVNSDVATAGKTYIVYLPKLDISGLSDLGDTYTIFGIYYLKNGSEVTIKTWAKSEYNNLPEYYIFTYPSDAEQLRFRIRATSGSSVDFCYSEYTNIEEKVGVYPNKFSINALKDNALKVNDALNSFDNSVVEIPLTWEAGTISAHGVPDSSNNAYRSAAYIPLSLLFNGINQVIFTTPDSAAPYAAFVFQYSSASTDGFISRTPAGGLDNYGKNGKIVTPSIDSNCKYVKVVVVSYQDTIPLETTITDNCKLEVINKIRKDLDKAESDIEINKGDISDIKINLSSLSSPIELPTTWQAGTINASGFPSDAPNAYRSAAYIPIPKLYAIEKIVFTTPNSATEYAAFVFQYSDRSNDSFISRTPAGGLDNYGKNGKIVTPSIDSNCKYVKVVVVSYQDTIPLETTITDNCSVKIINQIREELNEVNNEINDIYGIPKSVSSTGNGTNFRFLNNNENSSKRGRNLRVYIPTLDLTGVQDMPETNTIFGIVNYNGTDEVYIKAFTLAEAANLPEYYDFIVPNNLVDLRFRVRCTSGSPFTISWVDLDDINLRNHEMRINNIEEELNKESSIISRNTDKIANIYAGCNAWRGYEPLDKKFALLVFTDLHSDADRMNNALHLLDNCEVIDAGLFLGDLEQATAQTGTFIPNVAVPAFNDAQKDVFAVIGNHDQRQYVDDTITVEASVSRFMGAMTKVSSNYQARGYGYKDFADYKIRIIMLNPYDYPDDKDQNDKCLIFGDIPMYQQAQINWFISTLNSVPEDYTVLVAAHFVDACVADNNIIPQHINAYGVYNNSSLNRGDNGFQDGSVISDIINAYKNKTTLVHSYNYISRTLNQNGVTYNLVCPTPSMPSTLDVNADFSNAEGTFACYLYGHIHKESFCKMSAHNDQIAYGQDASHCWRQSTGYWTSGWSLTPRDKDSVTQDLLNVFCVDTKNKMINVVRIGATTTMFGEKYEIINFSYA